MKKHEFKFQSHEQEEIAGEFGLTQPARGQEFQTPEEVLRFDAAQTEVPPEVEERLAESIRNETDPPGTVGLNLI